MRQNCPEFIELNKLENKIADYKKSDNNKLNLSKIENSTEVILEQLDFVANEMVYGCGGYCAIDYTITSLPVLPYRKDNVKSFAHKNFGGLITIINKHINYLENEKSRVFREERDSILSTIDNISNQNIINALISFRKIEVMLIKINKTFANKKS